MNYIFQFFTMMLTAVFVENIIFTRALGTSWLFYLVKKPAEILKYTLLTAVVTTLSGLIGYPFRSFVYNHAYHHFLVPMLYIGVLSLVYIGVYFFIKKLLPKEFENIGMNLGAAVFNCASLGSLLVPAGARLDLLSTLGYGLGLALGFGLAIVFVGYGLKRLEYCRVPKIFKGVPIALIYLGLLSLAFYGLIGHQLAT